MELGKRIGSAGSSGCHKQADQGRLHRRREQKNKDLKEVRERANHVDSMERTFQGEGTEHTNPAARLRIGVSKSRKEAVGWSAVTRGEIIGERTKELQLEG